MRFCWSHKSAIKQLHAQTKKIRSRLPAKGFYCIVIYIFSHFSFFRCQCVCVYFALLVFNLLVMLLKSFARVPLNVQILFFNLFSSHFDEKGYCPYDKKNTRP